MVGVRLGGIDPSILRELSGVYKPFVKAFKELISNAFDADANRVVVQITDDFTSVSVNDDGSGMSPFEFRNDFTRIGGGSRRWSGDRTPRGRLRIGSKGIGFLAMARYCSRLEVESEAGRVYSTSFEIDEVPKSLDLEPFLGFRLPPGAVASRARCSIRQVNGKIGHLKSGQHYRIDSRTNHIVFNRRIAGPIAVKLSIDSSGLRFTAALNFEQLLLLADKADLEKLSDFASIEVIESEGKAAPTGTRIVAHNLKDFVRRELRAGRRKGRVRNIESQAGLDRFIWHLSRCTPVPYRPVDRDELGILDHLPVPKRSVLKSLEVTHGATARAITRPIYPFEERTEPLHEDMFTPIEIRESGLEARGFIAGYESVIFPAEYRGITVRVRGVAIGEPGFLGVDGLLTGARKAALSQITGEINVLRGLDAADALNPGRESFYEENKHYKILRNHLVGDTESVGGLLGSAIGAVLRRSQVRTSLSDVLGRAGLRRRAMDDVSAAVAFLLANGGANGAAMRKLLQKRSSRLNGLDSSPDLQIEAPPRIGGLAVVSAQHLPREAEVDYTAEEVRLDFARPNWDWSLQLFDRRFQVVSKKGGENGPLGELDLKSDRILLNWEHPVRVQMDERGFLRTALSWTLAREAANDPDQMMDLALSLLSFRTGAAGD